MNRSFSVVLVNPNDPGSYRTAMDVTENLGVCLLTAYLEQNGISVSLCDARFDNLSSQDAYHRISKSNVDLLGVSLGTIEGSEWTQELIKAFRQRFPNTHITIGGYFPTLQYEQALELLPEVDSVVLNEGEITLHELVEALKSKQDWKQVAGIVYRESDNKGIKKNPKKNLVKDLDSLPWAKRYVAPKAGESFEVFIEGSRGCVFSCTFCAIRPFYGGGSGDPWRVRSGRSIVDEMKFIKKKNNKLRRFRFVDPDFIGPAGHARAHEFAELAANELEDIRYLIEGRAVSIVKSEDLLIKLKKAGLSRLFIGIESGSQKILDKINKRTTVEENLEAVQLLKNLDIDFAYGFMMITPWTDEDDIEKNIIALEKIGKIQMNKFFHELHLIPGTAAFKQAQVHTSIKPLSDSNQGNSGYYTYPSLTLSIERIRKVGFILENKKISFMKKLWYIYKLVRNLVQANLAGSKELEYESDKLFLEVYRFCWNKARYCLDLTEEQIVNHCMENFITPINTLLNKLEEKTSLKTIYPTCDEIC